MTLEVRALARHFGGVKAVDGVDFDVAAGQCVALIGPNGAGKSTLFACIAGQQQLDAGEVRWRGVRIDQLSPAQRLARGVARTFQVAQTFEALTVSQNVRLALAARLSKGLRAWDAIDATHASAAGEILARVGLMDQHGDPAAELPYGAKKRLELAIAMAADPQLLLLDEPAAGLALEERASLMDLVKSLTLSGKTVLYTEHNMDAVFGVADRVLVLVEGRLLAQGAPAEIARNEEVRARYLAPRNSMLEVRDLDAWYGPARALFGVSLSVRAGELVVLQGLNGAGKSTLLRSLIGIGPRVAGAVEYEGRAIGTWPAHRRARAGIGYVAEDRRLFTALSVGENIDIASRGAATARVDVLELFPALAQMLGRKAGLMSGGEQQMLAIARTLAARPRLLLLDEPCEGIAPVLVIAIRDALLKLKERGVTMLVAEQNQLLASHADRVLKMNSGRLQGNRPENPNRVGGSGA